MRRIRFSGGSSSNCALLGTTFPFSNYTNFPFKTKSFLKLLPSRTSLIFTTPHYRLVTAAQHSSTPQTNLSVDSGGSGRNGYPLKDSKVVLKGMRYTDLEKLVQSYGYRPAINREKLQTAKRKGR